MIEREKERWQDVGDDDNDDDEQQQWYIIPSFTAWTRTHKLFCDDDIDNDDDDDDDEQQQTMMIHNIFVHSTYHKMNPPCL